MGGGSRLPYCMTGGFQNHVIHGMDMGHYLNVKIVIL